MLNDNIRRCNHTKTNGIQCGSPALRNSEFCYFHRKARHDFPGRQVATPPPSPVIDLALIDDPDAIHYALMQVAQAVLNGTITDKQAGRVLQALHIMTLNFKRTTFQRQLEDEYNKSNLNAYETWEKYAKLREEEKLKRQHEQRMEELKRAERTCCKCKSEVEEAVSVPKIEACKDEGASKPVFMMNAQCESKMPSRRPARPDRSRSIQIRPTELTCLFSNMDQIIPRGKGVHGAPRSRS